MPQANAPVIRTKVTTPAPAFEGVAAGQTAVCKLPIGRTMHSLELAYTVTTLAQMNEIRVLVDNEVKRRFSGGDRLDTLNQIAGLPAAAGILKIPFNRIGMKNREAEDATLLGTGIQNATPNNVHVEVDLDAGVGANPTLALTRYESAARPSGLTLVSRERTLNPSTAGVLDVQDMALGTIINAIHFHSNIVTDVELLLDDRRVYKRTKAVADKFLNNGDAGRVPNANVFSIDTTEGGYGDEGIITAGRQNVLWKITTSGAGAVPVTIETIEPALT